MYRLAAARSRSVFLSSPLHLWLVAVLLFGVGDVATTAVGLSVPGVIETDPVALWFLERFGFASLLGLKAAAFGACYVLWVLVPSPHCWGVPLGLAVVGVSVTAWNSLVVATAV